MLVSGLVELLITLISFKLIREIGVINLDLLTTGLFEATRNPSSSFVASSYKLIIGMNPIFFLAEFLTV